MSEMVTVERFCAIEDVHCHKVINFNGPWTFFFAYPSSPRMQSFTAELVCELSSRGIEGVRWEDIVSTDLLFSKVCEGIHANGFLIAEVTEPNPNVMLEVGYALAVGRQPLLLQNRNRESWSRDLLTTLEGCYYATREDIHRYIANSQAQSTLSTDPNSRLPFLENMGLYGHQEVRGTAYHLKPKISADWISRVDKTFSGGGYFKLTSMDPSDSVYDEFLPQARQIQRASLIVASFVSRNSIGWEHHNANVALLTGFAVGLGKQVLVLQEEPLAPILDLGSVSRPFETEHQVKDIVESWIDRQVRLSVSQAIESRQRSASRQQADFLRNIYMGHPDALQDNELLEYFVPTKEFHDAVEGNRTVFIGRRGTGKSANFQAIKAEVSSQSNVIDVEILPDDFQLERITGFIEQQLDLPNPKLIFQSIWNYVLTSELLRSLGEGTDRLYYSPGELTRDFLRQAYEYDRENMDLDFGSRVVSALTRVLTSNTDMSPEERQSHAEESIKSLRNYELGRRLRDFANEEGITYFIVADDLDKHWRPNTRQSIELLLGLIAEVARMQRYYQTDLKIVLFLREDIYDVLTKYDEDLPKRDFLRIEWTHSNLKHLVAERLASRADQGNDDDEETWRAISPEPVNGMFAEDYILTRSLPRPRDVLNFCQRAIDQAQRNGHTYVNAQDILDGERSFSEALFYSVSSEFKGIYPELEDVLVEFLGVAEKLSWEEFEEASGAAIRNKGAIIVNWIGGEDLTVYFLAEVLFKIGLIGFSREWTSTVHFCNGRSISETWRLVSSRPTVHIHPAFTQILEVSEAMLNPPRRSARRRSGVSPLQLSFDERPD